MKSDDSFEEYTVVEDGYGVKPGEQQQDSSNVTRDSHGRRGLKRLKRDSTLVALRRDGASLHGHFGVLTPMVHEYGRQSEPRGNIVGEIFQRRLFCTQIGQPLTYSSLFE